MIMDTDISSKRMYDTVLKACELMFKSFDRNDENKEVEFRVSGDPFPVHFKITVRSDKGLLTFFSVLGFKVAKEKRQEFSLKICKINYEDLYAGSFDFNPETGAAVFRVSVPYKDSLISKETVCDIIKYIRNVLNEYNEELFMLSRGAE